MQTITINITALAVGYNVDLTTGPYSIAAGCKGKANIKRTVLQLIDLAGDHLIPKEGGA